MPEPYLRLRDISHIETGTKLRSPPVPSFQTSWDTKPNPLFDIWTVTSASEVVPGVVTPLVASTFNHYDEIALRRLMREFPGGHKVRIFKPPVANFFGIFAGRLALNIGFTAAAMSMLDPKIAEAMLQQLFTSSGGAERFLVASSDKMLAANYEVATAQRRAAPGQLAATKLRLLAERHARRASADANLTPAEAWSRWEALWGDNTDLLNRHYVVSVAAAEFQVRLAALLADNDLDPTAVVPLCSGLGDLESALPPQALFDVARAALRHADLAAALEAEGAEAVLPKLSAWPGFVKVFDRFLEVYGYRGQGEVDPTNADWSEEPLFALSQVRSMLSLGDKDAPKAHVRQATARRRAFEKTVRRQLPALRRPLFDLLSDQAQHFTRLRELSKATWVMGMRRARAPYLAMAGGLARRGAIAQSDDLRFLVQSEVKSLCAGRSIGEAANIVGSRRREFRRARRFDLPDHWVGKPKTRRRPPPKPTKVLAGLGVSEGQGPVTGMVRIVPSAEAGFAREVAPGEILVAPFTDAPWTPLFIPAGAVIVETGGVLSHAATVAREFAIPCVAMVKDATRLLHDGDRVTVDGRTGSVIVVERD